MLKYSLSFLAGALVISLAVVLSGARPFALVGLGFVVSIFSCGVILRAVGFDRTARFFLRLDSFVVGAPLGARERSADFPRSRSEGIRAGLSGSYGLRQGSRRGVDPAGQLQRAHAVNPLTVNDRREKRQQQKRLGVKSIEMLPTVQQDVLSALVNQGVPFRKAEQTVRGAAEDKPGISFDELFRACVDALNVRRKAA